MTQPFLYESSSTPGEFLICGAVNNNAYALRVDAAGTVIWSMEYSANYSLHPYEIVECPYTGDIAVAGVANNAVRANDGFFMRIDASNGSVNLLQTYGHPVGVCNEFFAIDVAESTEGGSDGFVIGGFSDPVSSTGNCWFLKVDVNGNIIWNYLVQPSSGNGPVNSVLERLNSAGNYEYFGASLTFAGYTILKLAQNGLPAAGSNEFTYDAPSPFWSNPIHITDIPAGGASPNEGIHIFGRDELTPNNTYLVNAYYNGASGCETGFSIMAGWENGPGSIDIPSFSEFGGPDACPNFTIFSYSLNTSPNYICSASSVSYGSNARTVGLPKSMDSHKLGISPNPTSGQIEINIREEALQGETLQIIDAVGRTVASLQLPKEGISRLKIDLNKFNLESGVYIFKINSTSTTIYERVIFQK